MKNKLRHVSSSSPSSSSDSEGDTILEKFIGLIQGPEEDKEKVSNEESKTEKKKEKKKRKKEKHHRHHHHSKKERINTSNKTSSVKPLASPQKPQNGPSENPLQTDSRNSYKSTSRSRHDANSSRCTTDKRKSRSRSRSPEGRLRHTSDRGPNSKSPLPRYRSSPRRPIHKPRSGERVPDEMKTKSRLTAAEMAALRAQMAADAKERDEERRRRFEQHIAEKTREEQVEGEARITHGASFLRKLTLDHVASTSVEEVIQRNAKSRQKGGMDKNFLRK